MSSMVLRAGLWLTLLSFAVYVGGTVFPMSPLAGLANNPFLITAVSAGIAMIGLGILLRFVERLAPKSKKRCAVCRNPVIGEGIYCREHLRELFEEEDSRTRAVRTRPD